MARYIIKLKSGVSPDDIIQSTLSAEEILPTMRISPLYDRINNLENISFEQPDEVQSEINEIREKLDRTYIVEVDDQQAAAAVVSLSQDENIESIEPDEQVEEYQIPNDSHWQDLYGLHNMDCETAWDQSMGIQTLVAVVDSGIDVSHQDLEGNIWKDNNGNHGYNEVDGNYNINDDTSHGTHVSGTIGAIINNGTGVVGVAPKCTIMGIRGLKNGKGSLSILLRCIRKAVDLGAKVINNSWGPGNRDIPDTDLVLRYAYLHDVNVVFSAGNNGRAIRSSQIVTNPTVICVASVDQNDKRSSFSNYGPEVTVSAPGTSILSTTPGNNYGWKSGTSMAAPHVSGLIALLISKKSTLKPDEIRLILQQSCDQIKDTDLGAGRVNANKALAML